MKDELIIKNLTFKHIFDNFNMTFPNKKLIFLSGPNNCGKTTLIRMCDRKIETKNSIFINNQEINTYNEEEFIKIIECVIPNEIRFKKNTIEEEIEFYDDGKVNTKKIIKDLKLTKYKKSIISNLEKDNKIKLQLLLSLIKNPQFLWIDNIFSFFKQEDVDSIINVLKEYIEEYNTTIVINTTNLEETINGDYLIIIEDSKIVLEGKPLEVLEKDNIINKIGLDLPFMIDLSVKLKDYDLLKEIVLNKEDMINTLWK